MRWPAHIIERVIEEPGMKSMDPAQMEPILQSLVDEYPYMQFVYVVDMQGKKITRNICQPVDQAKYANVPRGRKLFEPPVVHRALEGREDPRHGPLLFETYGGSLYHGLGTDPKRGGRDQRILGLDIRFEDLTKSEEE